MFFLSMDVTVQSLEYVYFIWNIHKGPVIIKGSQEGPFKGGGKIHLYQSLKRNHGQEGLNWCEEVKGILEEGMANS